MASRTDRSTTLADGACVTIFAAEMARNHWKDTLDDVRIADCVITLGADLVETHQVAGFFVKRALPTGTKLIVVEDQSSKLSEFADEKHKTKEICSREDHSGLLIKAAKVSIVLGLVTPVGGCLSKV